MVLRHRVVAVGRPEQSGRGSVHGRRRQERRGGEGSRSVLLDLLAEILTIVQWMNAIGPDKLSPESIAEQAKAFKGPLALGPPTVQCGEYPDAPAICNDQMKVFKYEGKGVFKPAWD